MANSLTFLVLVTGLAGKGMLSDSMQLYLLQRFAAGANIRPVVFNTINFLLEDIAPCPPNLNDSALELLQLLQAERQKEVEAQKETEGLETAPDNDEEQASEQNKSNPGLVFLAHDIGGFVVKQALLLANLEFCFEWIAMGTAAALFFGTPHTVPEHARWESLIVKMLAESESMLDFLSFLHYLPNYVAQLEREFEALSGSYHIINFLPNGRRSSVVTQVNLQRPIYRCDKAVALDCEPEEMWDVGEEKPWIDSIRRVVNSHIQLDSKDPEEASRRLSLSLARLHPELHQLRAATHGWVPADVATWIARSWCDEWVKSSETCLLHVVGSPGSGKSVSASTVASRLRLDNRLVLSFSVKKENKQRSSPVDLFRSFCQQALLSPSALHSTTQVCSWLIEGALFTTGAFSGLLCSILSSYTGKAVFCIIHGINNYSPDVQKQLLANLEQVRNASQTAFKVLLTSDTEEEWHGVIKPGKVVNLDEEIQAGPELKRLAEAQLKNVAVAKPVWRTLKPEVMQKLWTGSSTLFELTQKISFLNTFTPATPKEAEDLVKALPNTFPTFFDYLESSRCFVSHHSLPWITHSVRSMTLSELAVCIAIDDPAAPEVLTTDYLKKNTPWSLRAHLEKVLSPVIRIIGERVQISHPLYEERILAAPEFKGNIHLRLLTKCVDYIKAISATWSSSGEFERENRLVEYASLHWPDHYHRVVAPNKNKPLESDIEEAYCSVLSLLQDAIYFNAWLNMFSHYAKAVLGRKRLSTTSVHIASSFGLTTVLERLLLSVDPEEKSDMQLQKALELAAEHGYVEVVRLFVKKGVRSSGVLVRAARTGDMATMVELLETHKEYIDSRVSPDGVYTPLLQAARCGHLDIFTLLRNEGADIQATTVKTKLSTLHLATRIGHDAIVGLAIDADVPLGLTDERGYTALAYAAEAGFADIVSMIIKANSSSCLPDTSRIPQELFINGQTSALDAPLHLAAANGHSKTVQVLLDNGAKPRLQNEFGYTPLHYAAERGFQEIVERLLGAMDNHPESSPQIDVQPVLAMDEASKVPSPLQLAMKSQHLGTVAKLRTSKAYGSKEALSSALTTACCVGNTECVLYLLEWHKEEYPEDETLRGEDGNTALHLAAKRGDSDLFREVSKTPYAQIGSYNNDGRTPLHEAAISGSFSILQGFSDDPHFSDLTSDDTHKMLLHLAAEVGHIHIVRWLMKYPAHKKEKAVAAENTAVMLAASNEHEEVVKLLLEYNYATTSGRLLHLALKNCWDKVIQLAISPGAGADPTVLNWKDPTSGDTALHIAVQCRRVDTIRMLLDSKIDANIKNNHGMSPFAMAMAANNLETVKTLLDGAPSMAVEEPDNAGMTPFLRACEDGVSNLSVIRELLEKRGSDVNLNATYPEGGGSKVFGKTPLHLAGLLLTRGEENSDFLLNLLLKHGADPNMQNARGSTPLFLAAEEGHLEAVKTLIKYGADPKSRNSGGSTALHRASQNGHIECMEELLKGGADINAEKDTVDNATWGVTPLVVAVARSEGTAVEKLLDLNATPGRALHFTALAGEVSITKTLLNYADPTVYDRDLGTVLHAAVIGESQEMVELWLSTPGIDINIADPVGRTPMIIAVIQDNKKLVETLIEAKADANKRDHEMKTPLDHAITDSNAEIVELLCSHTKLELDGGAGVRGHSPLFLASRMDSDRIFDIVNVSCKSLEPEKYAELCDLALHAAIASHEEDRFDQLLNINGVKATVEDDDGWTPLDCATFYDRSEMKEKLEQKLSKRDGRGAGEPQTRTQATKEPIAWHTNDRNPILYQPRDEAEPRVIKVAMDLLQIGPDEDVGVAVARADHCIPRDQDYYFEITVKQGFKNGEQNIGIGLSDDAAPLNRMLGFGGGVSYGYHADDGSTYATNSRSKNLYSKSRDYGEGETVGCGFDAKNGCVYFTKEGRRLGETFDHVCGKLYPAVFFNAREVGVCISAVFPQNGVREFRYKWTRDGPTAEIEKSNITNSTDEPRTPTLSRHSTMDFL